MATFLERHFGRPLSEFLALNHEQRAGAVRSAIPDLNFFFDEGVALDAREAPARTRSLALGLHRAIADVARSGDHATTLRERIVTDAVLRAEADRDQNVYLGRLFTRTLTRAVPDLIFQPVTLAEVSAAFRWARATSTPLTLRGAGSTAMGGSVPNDGGVTLELSRLDEIDVDAGARTCVVGAGARLRIVHERLAARGLALPVYPSNLGGTLAGWFVSGGTGLNAFGRGRIIDHVRGVDAVLPAGEHVRFHSDGRIDVPGEHDGHRATLDGAAAAEWFRARRYAPITLQDFASSEGTFGLVLRLTVAVEPRTEIGAFMLAFGDRAAALEAAAWIERVAGSAFARPANLKLYSPSHVHHVHTVWADEDAREKLASALTAGPTLPWTRIAGPAEFGVSTQDEAGHAGAYLFVDFLGLEGARGFATALAQCPGAPRVLGQDSVRFAAERFKPQQTKRLGPGLLAAEVVLPTSRLVEFLPAAEQLAAGAGMTLDGEVYFLQGGRALAITDYQTDHRRGSFALELMLAPAITELAMRRFEGRPYVLGRWQSPFFGGSVGREAARITAARASLDPGELLNRGVYTSLRLRGPLGAIVTRTFLPGIALLRAALASPLSSPLVRIARGALAAFPGPAAGRGAPALVGARFTAAPPPAVETASGSVLLAIPPGGAIERDAAFTLQPPEDRALHCVNCGECNSVCPVFHESKIRLPQMLTHIGEGVRAGETIGPTGSALLDLCMRCGNCEEVCQAGIPHLALYERMQAASDRARPRDRERHLAIVAAVRGSNSYRRDFLGVREGAYLRRSPASLPGATRFVVMRSENDAGAASTCIHCGACVPVCPTEANRDYEGADPRWITTVQSRCIGCGSCVEVCPANLANGGRTLRVMEAPTPGWFAAIEEFAGPLREGASETTELPIQ